MIERLIDDWGTADLNELLDYVYFETEPMFKVELRQKLDFSKVKGKRKKREIELSRESKEKLGELGKRIKKRLEEIELIVEPFIKLPPELKGKSCFWKEEVEDLSNLKGKIKVKNV
jgi:CRISPR/Cas system-associated exonuclease Cas4 (RecB family)